MAVVEFGSEHTFRIENEVIKPGSLFNGQIVEIHGQTGEYKVVGKNFTNKKLSIKCVKMGRYQFKTFHNPSKEAYGVEAQCVDVNGNNEFLIAIKGAKTWVPALDCSGRAT